MNEKKDKGDVNMFTLSILLIGVFPGLGVLFFIGEKTLIRVDAVFNIAAVAGIIVFVMHLPFLKKLNRYLAEIIGFALLGWGLIITALFMGSNYLFHGQPVTDIYRVITATAHPEDRELPFPVSVTISQFENLQTTVPSKAYDDYPDMLKFKGNEEQKFIDQPKQAKMTTAKGLFGYSVLLSKELD